MPKSKKTSSKRKAQAPTTGGIKKTEQKDGPSFNRLFVKRPKVFGIGGSMLPKRDMTRFVKWPKYVKMQRKMRILKQRLKVPPVINQFNNPLEKNLAVNLFKLLAKHKKETKQERNARLKASAKKPEGEAPKSRPLEVVAGIRAVTTQVEQKKAKLVVIAHDVDPIELVLWLPTVCVKKGIPYCIVKSKSRLGQIAGVKTCAAVALTDVKAGSKNDLANMVRACEENFNSRYSTMMKTSGGLIKGKKHIDQQMKKKRIVERLEKKREGGF